MKPLDTVVQNLQFKINKMKNTGFIIMIHYKSNTNTLWQNINGTVNLMVNLTINLLEISGPINTMILIY